MSAPEAADSASNPAVRCRGVTKTYGTGDAAISALRGVDLEVRCGELLMIVGPSGCGKTSLISIIGAVIDQDSGACEVAGRDIKIMSEAQRAQFRGASIGFVFQVFNLVPTLTAAENVAVPLLISGVPWKDAEARSRKVLQSVGLGTKFDTLPAHLSGGQQQRVAIARALVHEPDIVICDEPTSSLDHETGHDMMTTIRDIARQPERAVIVVTHDPRIFQFADRIAHMDDGRIIDITTGGLQ